MILYVRDDLRDDIGSMTFDDFLALPGETAKKQPGTKRETVRVAIADRRFFLKRHWGVGWYEILKNLISLKMPVVGATTECTALRELPKLEIHTLQLAAFGCRGRSPATQQSFVMTDALKNVDSLENICPGMWAQRRANPRLRYALIDEVGRIARQLHGSGRVHQDFYLCHILVDLSHARKPLTPETLELYLVDLHRVQKRGTWLRRWYVKDLAALYFSAMDLPLTIRDRLRFVRAYSGERSLRDSLMRDRNFWAQVRVRALRLYRRIHGQPP